MAIDIRTFDSAQPGFEKTLDELLAWESVSDHQVQQIVTDILADVKSP